jgi:hypothetical protein
MPDDRESLNRLLMRSVELERDLSDLFRFDDFGISPRWSTSRVICAIAFEHAESAKLLANAGNFTSSVGLLRLQFEALVRAFWLYYGASDAAVEKLAAELTHESAQRANNLPMAAEMLEQLKQSQCPPVAVDQLSEFREYSGKALNSFVHGGLHAIRRHDSGYPVELLLNLIRQSNGLSLMAGQLLVILHGGRTLTGSLPQLHLKYMDCLPEPKGLTL